MSKHGGIHPLAPKTGRKFSIQYKPSLSRKYALLLIVLIILAIAAAFIQMKISDQNRPDTLLNTHTLEYSFEGLISCDPAENCSSRFKFQGTEIPLKCVQLVKEVDGTTVQFRYCESTVKEVLR